MVPLDIIVERCAPEVPAILMRALVRAESAWQPLAIGIDGGRRAVVQPKTLEEAVATATRLSTQGLGFSVGLAQIHATNVRLYGLSWVDAFDPCRNLAVGQKILWNFYHRASASGYAGRAILWAALRGYNSGNVDRAISDDYASRVFAYMSSSPLAMAPATGLDSAARRSLGMPRSSGAGPGSVPAPPRADEAVDIFHRPAQRIGF